MAIETAVLSHFNQQIGDILTEHQLQAPLGGRMTFGMDEDDDSGELKLLIESAQQPALAAQLQQLLNHSNYEYVVDSFLGLEQFTAREQIHQAAQDGRISTAGGVSYKQEFALKANTRGWQLDIIQHPIKLTP